MFAAIFAGFPRRNPNSRWWENLLVQAVFFGVLGLALEVVRRVTKKAPESNHNPPEQAKR